MSAYVVKGCPLCGDAAIDANVDGRVVTTSCRACRAVLSIEFDPPDEPALRARIERIDVTHAEARESDRDTRTARKRHTQNSPIVLVVSRRR